jgi:hypothetical protein
MSQPTNLWWAYDSENGSFSALPAGPFLLPALIIVGIVSLFQGLNSRELSPREMFGSIVDTPTWKQRHARYIELVHRRVNNGELELAEHEEFRQLKAYVNNPYGFPQ